MSPAAPEDDGLSRAPNGGRGRGLLMRLLGASVALGLLWLAAKNVPWEDQLMLRMELPEQAHQAGAKQLLFTVEGDLVGDWKDPRVGFQAHPEALVQARLQQPDAWQLLPERLRRELEAGQELDLSEDLVHWRDGSSLELHGLEWRPAIGRVFVDLRWTALLPALGLLLLCTLFIVTRWWVLLAAMGCGTRWLSALRVTYVGLFFNVIFPGSSGGDLARAWIVVKGHQDRRADAFMSVILDRLLGLVAMGLVAAVAVFGNDERFAVLRLPVGILSAGMILGIGALGSRRLRRWIKLDQWIERIPQGERLARLDQAIRTLSSHRGQVLVAVLLSVGNHLGASIAIATLGTALGADLSLLDYVCIATVVNTLTAVPISLGGLGVGEVLSGTLFVLAGDSYTLGVACSVTFRICLSLLGLAGGLILLAPGGRQMRSDLQQAEREREALPSKV